MEQQGERLSADINFPKVLFLHINRVAQSANEDVFAANVDMLESLLYPYIDDDYQEALKNPHAGMINILNLDGSTYGKEGMVNRGKEEFIREKFRALMVLAQRRNLLIQKTGEGYDTTDETDDESEGYDTVDKTS